MLMLSLILTLPCASLAQRASTKGTDFWLTFMQNSFTPRLYLFFGADSAATATVRIGSTALATITIPAKSNVAYEVTDLNAYIRGSDQVAAGKGIHVTSNKPITVCAFNTENQSTDATIVYPTMSLGDEYYLASYQHFQRDDWASQGAIVGTKDGTMVEIIPKAAVARAVGAARPAGVAYTITLNRGDVYQFQSEFPNEDLSGTRIRVVSGAGECGSIAVFGGHQRTPVPSTSSFSRDHLIEQMPPWWSLGKTFVVPPMASAIRYVIRVISTEPSTTVTLAGVPTLLTQAGSVLERTVAANAAYLITADKPVITTWLGMTWTDGFDLVRGVGDPFMMVVPPVEQRIKTFTFTAFVPPTTTVQPFVDQWKNNLYLTLIGEPSELEAITVDDITVAAIRGRTTAPVVVTSTNVTPQLSCVVLRVDEGVHAVDASKGSGAIGLMYGLSALDSYGFVAGAQVENLRTKILVYTPPICPGKPVTIRGYSLDSAEVNSWDWFFPHDGTTDTGTFIRRTFRDTGTYVVRLVTTRRGCVRDTISTTIEVRQPFTVRGRAIPEIICSGSTADLVVTDSSSTRGLRYRWRCLTDTGTFVAGDTGSRVRVRHGRSGLHRYVLLATDTSGCRDEDTVLLNVIDAPRIVRSADTTLCVGDSIACNASAADSLAVRFSWRQLSGTGVVRFISDSQSSNVRVRGVRPGMASIIVEALNTRGCRRSDTIRLRVVEVPSIVVSGPRVIRTCLDSAQTPIVLGTNITVSGASPPYRFIWTEVDGSLTSIVGRNDQRTVAVRPVRTTRYRIRVSDSGTPSSCSAEETLTVEVSTQPVLALTADTTICVCSDTTLLIGSVARCGIPPYRYSWQPQTGLSNPSSAQTGVTRARPDSSTLYVLTVIDSTGATERDSVLIRVAPCPKVSPMDTLRVCDSVGIFTLRPVVSLLPSGSRFLWTPSTYLSDPTSTNPTAKLDGPDSVMTYRLVVTTPDGCKGWAEVTVVRHSPFQVHARSTSAQTSVCRGDTVRLVAVEQGGTAPFRYRWTAPDGLSVWVSDSASPVIRVDSSTRIVITVTDARGCSALDTLTVSIRRSPDVLLGSDTTICASDSAVGLFVSRPSECGIRPFVYNWQPAERVTIPDAQRPWNAILRPSGSTLFTLSVTDDGGRGQTTTDSMLVSVSPSPTVDGAVRLVKTCLPDSIPEIVFSIAGGSGPYDVRWYGDSSLITSQRTADTARFDFKRYRKGEMVRMIRAVITDIYGCETSDSAVIDLSDQPLCQITGPAVICLCDSAELNSTIRGGTAFPDGSYVRSWSIKRPDGDTVLGGLPSVRIEGRAGDSITLQLRVTDARGCTGIDTHTVRFAEPPAELKLTAPSITADPRSDNVQIPFSLSGDFTSLQECRPDSLRTVIEYNENLYDPFPLITPGRIILNTTVATGGITLRQLGVVVPLETYVDRAQPIFSLNGKALVGFPGYSRISVRQSKLVWACEQRDLAEEGGELSLDSLCISPDGTRRMLDFNALTVLGITPHPNNGTFSVLLNVARQARVDLQVFSALGTMLCSTSVAPTVAGESQLRANLSCPLTSGHYLLIARSGNTVTSTSLLVIE